MAHGEGFLTTHILDTANGCPAGGVRIEVFRIEGNDRNHIKSVVTNADGRTDEPILATGQMAIGTYEMVFEIGAYFRERGHSDGIAFIDEVPLRFGISDQDDHYHVPLLASPFSYSTYRGS